MGTLYTVRSGATAMAEDSFLQDLTDLISQSGVKDLGSDNHLKVVQRAAGANMSVDVGTGRAFVKIATGNAYPVRHESSASNVAITSNSSGSTRKDAVIVWVDKAASPTATADNVAKLKVVAGTPSGSPSSPSDSDIQTNIGAGNPFLRLADVTVVSGAASIANASILDRRVRFKIRPSLLQGTATDAATTTYDVSSSNYIEHTLGGNRTLAVSGDSTNDMFIIKLIQDGTGSRTVTWWSGIDWDGNVAPTLTATPNRADIFAFYKKTNGRYDAFELSNDKTIF